MDRVEQRDGFLGLVRLELADEVQLGPRKAFAQLRPLGLRFLDAVLAEYALPGLDQRGDRLGLMRLADRDQRHFAALAPRDAAGVGDAILNGGKSSGCAFHYPRYSEAMRVRQT